MRPILSLANPHPQRPKHGGRGISWILLLACFGMSACKNGPPSCLSDAADYQASVSKGDTYYGGFLRIHSPDHTTTDCEVMIMPQSTEAASFHHWDNLTLYTARSCLEVDQESGVSLLLYTGPKPSQTSSAYIELPLTSPYLRRLGEVRSQFMEAYRTMASPQNGRIKLKIYEAMMAQIHRLESINFQKSWREHGWIKPKEKLPPPAGALFKSMQADLCAHGVLSGAVRPPLEDQRYHKLQEYRIDPEAHKHLGCYIFADLIAFDAKVELNQAERTSLATIWPPDLPPFNISRSVASDELAQLSRLQNLRPSRDLEFLTRRITDAQALAETFERVSPAEFKFFQALSSAWLQLPLSGHKAAGGIAKELGNNALNFMLRGKSKIGSPLESYINDVIPSSQLMLAGNVLATGAVNLKFRSRIINQDAQNQPTFKQHTFIDQQLYALFVATEPPRGEAAGAAHPLSEMTSGSFLLYGGHPIATLLVVNKASVPRADATISVYAYASYQQAEPAQTSTPPSTAAQAPQQPAAPSREPPQQSPASSPADTHAAKLPPAAGGAVAATLTTTAEDAAETVEEVELDIEKVVTPAVRPISESPSLRGEWFGSTTSNCPASTQVCDPDQPGCADDCTFCAAGDATKPGCTELASYRCEAGSTGCSDAGVKCTVNPRAAGCGYSADACERSTSLLGGLFGGAGRCPATMAPVADEVSPFNCGSK